jgi:hypothetical protein
VRGDEGPHLGEACGAVDGPVGSRTGDAAAVRHVRVLLCKPTAQEVRRGCFDTLAVTQLGTPWIDESLLL